jgi:hypothetical protein
MGEAMIDWHYWSGWLKLILGVIAFVGGLFIFRWLVEKIVGKMYEKLPQDLHKPVGYSISAVFALISLWLLVFGFGGAEALPFIVAGIVGFVLLGLSVYFKHSVLGVVGGGLVAAAFSHWVGPITFPK